MNITEAFADFLQDNLGIGTLGQTIFIGNAPNSNDVPDAIYWVVQSGGSIVQDNQTNESIKSTFIDVYYRDVSYQEVYDNLHSLEETLSCEGCVTLSGFDIIKIEVASFPVDQDLDNETRKVGLLKVNILNYKEC